MTEYVQLFIEFLNQSLFIYS